VISHVLNTSERMIRKILHKILGIDKVITQLNGRVTLIENIVGINSFMANEGNVGNVGSGNVGVGSTVPPDVARYQKALAAAVDAGNVGSGNVGSGNVGSGNVGSGNVGVGSTAPADEAGNVGSGNVGVGSTAPTTETQSLCPPNPGDGNVGVGSA
jgi:hypothetical protein